MVTDASEVERAPARQSDVNLYFPMAILCAGVAFLGFAPTYWAPILFGTLKVHPIIHVHAFVFFAWTLFFVVQTWLASTRRIARHRAMGLAAISLATAMTILGILVSIDRMYAAAAIGRGPAGLEFSIVPLGSIIFFAMMFAAALAPIARWFLTFLAPEAPAGPPPVAVDIGPSLVALLLLSIPMVGDWRRRGSVHQAYWIGATTYLMWKLLQVPLSTTSLWASIAGWIMRLAGQS
jgi:hypothetical protein